MGTFQEGLSVLIQHEYTSPAQSTTAEKTEKTERSTHRFPLEVGSCNCGEVAEDIMIKVYVSGF